MISIITVSLNAATTIEQSIRSVLAQTFPDIEYIVMDGGSTDGTVAVVKTYEIGLSDWVSEPDSGIAEAMNKGLDRATGDYVLFLNADDYLTDDHAIERLVPELDREIVAAPIKKRDGDGSERLVAPRGFNWWMNFKTGLHHQGTLCSRKLLTDLGGFETRYRLEMDYELFLRAYRRGTSVRILDEPFSVMRSGGISTRSDTDTLKNRLAEEKSIHYRHCHSAALKRLYALYWSVYPSYKLFRGSLVRRRYGV